MPKPPEKPLAAYVFLDEGGDLSFSPTGSRYFTMTSVQTFRPFDVYPLLTELRFDLIESGLDIEYFHASEDRQPVRDKVFEVIQAEMHNFRVDSILIEKRKTGPAMRTDNRFYPEMLGYLLQYVVKGTNLRNLSEIIVITDTIPIKRKRRAVEKAVKTVLGNMLPSDVPYRILHHASKSSGCLQVADYFNWAVFRKWERQDVRSYKLIAHAVVSEFDIFRSGSTFYY